MDKNEAERLATAIRLDRLYKAGDGEPEPLSSGTIRTVCRNIEDAVWKREQERKQ